MTESTIVAGTRRAVIAGATGLVGRHCLQRLLDDARYGQVLALARCPADVRHPKLSWHATTFTDLRPSGALLGIEDAYCCLGTTQRQAGSRAAFERVDYHMVVNFARVAHAAGARRFMVVSAFGADLASPAFYSRVKARMEQAVSEIGFESVHILRPSLLIGKRGERRPIEEIGQRVAPIVAPLLRGALAPLRPVRAEDVADALVASAFGPQVGVAVHRWPFERRAA